MNYSNKIFTILCILIICSSCHKSTSTAQKIENPHTQPGIIHKAHLDKGWYNQSANQLKKDIAAKLTLATDFFPCHVNPQSVRVIIAPHAGYYYSGLCAATAYQTLLNQDTTLPLERRKNTIIKRVIILSPSHTAFLSGIALPDYTMYRTVLGDLNVDTHAIAILRKNNLYKDIPDIHQKEHAIEIQLPFLQSTIADFSIVPLIVGHLKDTNDIDALCQRLERIIDNQTLVVISSDFTHHGSSYEYTPFSTNIITQIRGLDTLATSAIMQQSYYLFSDFLTQTNTTVCGKEAIKLLLALIEKRTFKQELIPYLTGYYTSAQLQIAQQTSPLKPEALFANVNDAQATSSVSYVGMVFASDPIAAYAPEFRLTGYEKRSLLALARSTIENSFMPAPHQLPAHLLYPIITPYLQQSVGAFVTLTTKQGQLRGCIGRITSTDALYKTVQIMALAAAFQDSRFPPLAKEELANITIDITVLTQPQKVDSYKDIVLGKHGIILHKHDIQGREIGSALFLPQVPREQRWDIETTLEELSHKAGFDYDAWQQGCSFEIFEGFEIKEVTSESK